MRDDDQFERLAERIERRLTEEIGKLRLDVTGEFGKVRLEIADLRSEMIDRNAGLLKWLLGFFVAQTAALAALAGLFR